MLSLLKRIFRRRPRLIERYENLEAIIDAHNTLIRKTLEIMRDMSVPPKYVLSRFKAIQDAEEKAIAAYWQNKNRKQDKWIKRAVVVNSDTMTDIAQANAPEPLPQELTATVEELPSDSAQQQSTQALEATPSKDNVIEIHINK